MNASAKAKQLIASRKKAPIAEQTTPENEPAAQTIEAPAEEPLEETPAEPEEETFYWLSSSFVDRIKDKEGYKGILVFYVEDETFDLEKVRSYIERAIEKTAQEEKIGKDKLELIFGGYRSGIVVEMWIVPKNGRVPALAPEERKAKEPDTIDR